MTDNLYKSKEEQRKEFEEIISTRANSKCQICYGLGFQGYSEQDQMYIPCPCVYTNLQRELEELNMPEVDKQGILNKLRQILGLN